MKELCNYGPDPSSAAPLVWPSPMFISELNQEAKVLLEKPLLEDNMEREKTLSKEADMPSSSLRYESKDDDILSLRTMIWSYAVYALNKCAQLRSEVRTCGYQMCAHCTLALCCHKKPDPATACAAGPVCPFCRGAILQLIVAKIKTSSDTEEMESSPTNPRRSRKSNFSEGSSSHGLIWKDCWLQFRKDSCRKVMTGSLSLDNCFFLASKTAGNVMSGCSTVSVK